MKGRRRFQYFFKSLWKIKADRSKMIYFDLNIKLSGEMRGSEKAKLGNDLLYRSDIKADFLMGRKLLALPLLLFYRYKILSL